MAQIDFAYNTALILHVQGRTVISDGTLSFYPFNFWDSISFASVNFYLRNTNSNATYTFSLGLYSLTGSSLSLANSASATMSISSNVSQFWLSITATSATQNITPGTWWLGFVGRSGGHSQLSITGITRLNAGNAFPGAFVGGRMTESTASLPASYATSNLDITGSDAHFVPTIYLSA